MLLALHSPSSCTLHPKLNPDIALQITDLLERMFSYARGVGHNVNLDGVPYSLQEDFVSSYRMHPLLPDQYLIAGDEVRRRTCQSANVLLWPYDSELLLHA